MVSDSIPNASIALSNPGDFAKKKRANRSAKLKQCKLDARREQWLSQVKNKVECKEEVDGGGVAGPVQSVHLESVRNQKIGKLEFKIKDEEEIYGDGSSMHNYSDSESLPFNSPTSSAANFSVSSRSSSSSSGRSSSSSSNDFDVGDVDDDDDCLDDWEAMADALAATDSKQQDNSPNTGKHESAAESGVRVEAHISSGNQERGGATNQRALVNCCAWTPHDAYRPQGLPNLSKQYSFPLNTERHFVRGSVWGCKNVGPLPTSCPICTEELDPTDTSFLPCACGFRLCLFCHKRIIEEDGRCPGCRKQYEFEPVEREAMVDGSNVTFLLSRSASMIARFCSCCIASEFTEFLIKDLMLVFASFIATTCR